MNPYLKPRLTIERLDRHRGPHTGWWIVATRHVFEETWMASTRQKAVQKAAIIKKDNKRKCITVKPNYDNERMEPFTFDIPVPRCP